RFEPFRQGNLINHFSNIRELQHRAVDLAMRGPIKVFLYQKLHGLGHCDVVQQDSPEHRLLRLQILWRQLRLRQVNVRHGLYDSSLLPRRFRRARATSSFIFIVFARGRPTFLIGSSTTSTSSCSVPGVPTRTTAPARWVAPMETASAKTLS